MFDTYQLFNYKPQAPDGCWDYRVALSDKSIYQLIRGTATQQTTQQQKCLLQ